MVLHLIYTWQSVLEFEAEDAEGTMYFHAFIHSFMYSFMWQLLKLLHGWVLGAKQTKNSFLSGTDFYTSKTLGEIYSVVVNDVGKKMRQGNKIIGIWGLIWGWWC